VDIGVIKDINIVGESQKLQLRWEVFDLMNHRNFITNPSNTASLSTNNTTFLNLGYTNVGGRSMLFTMRYMF
jgi:hypothetical protein